MAKRFMGIQKSHKGWCTPLSNEHCTGARRRLALTLKKHHGFHKKQLGGEVDPDQDQPAPQDQLAQQAPTQTQAVPMKRSSRLPKRMLKKKK